MERATGIEPALEAWEAPVLPLNYARKVLMIIDYVKIQSKNSPKKNHHFLLDPLGTSDCILLHGGWI